MSNTIKSERVRAGMSQDDLAEALGISRTILVSYEKDVGTCPTNRLISMSNLFGCSLDYLVGLTDERARK